MEGGGRGWRDGEGGRGIDGRGGGTGGEGGSAGPRRHVFVVVCRIILVVYPCCRVPVASLSSRAPLLCGRPVLSSRVVYPCGCHGAWCQRAGKGLVGCCCHGWKLVVGCCCRLWGGVGGPLWPFMGAAGRGELSSSLVVVVGHCWHWWGVVVGPLCSSRVLVVLWFHVVVRLYSLCCVAVVGSLLSCVVVLCVSKVGLEVREVSTYCGVLVQNNE